MSAVAGATQTVTFVLVPLFGAVACFLLPAAARVVALAVAVLLLANVIGLAASLESTGPSSYRIGGWAAPLGIDLYADGLTFFMLLTTSLTGLAVSVYGAAYFPRPTVPSAAGFWPLWLLLWCALNALFVSGDVFNIYVSLELMGLTAVALVALAGDVQAVAGAMRYLMMTMMASLTYLLGVGLLYHQAGTLDLVLLGSALDPVMSVWLALGLMIAALIIKSALFPLHFWLPPAHASAPVPVSAVLSALVVSSTFYLLVRLWLMVAPEGGELLGAALGALGASAIVWGSVQALRQVELKLLVAYSTVAQVGYLFLPFAVRAAEAALAWRGAMYFLLCHALAKAAMFMAVGNFVSLAGSGRMKASRLAGPDHPVTLAAFGVAGVTIIGLPPSGGFIGKWLLVEASIAAGQWWLTVVILGGSLLSAAYVFKVVGLAFYSPKGDREKKPVPGLPEWVALLLAIGALVLGFTGVPLLSLLEVGEPFTPGTSSPVLEEPRP